MGGGGGEKERETHTERESVRVKRGGKGKKEITLSKSHTVVFGFMSYHDIVPFSMSSCPITYLQASLDPIDLPLAQKDQSPSL